MAALMAVPPFTVERGTMTNAGARTYLKLDPQDGARATVPQGVNVRNAARGANHHAQLIGPRPRTTPVARPKTFCALPHDLLREASRRLGIASILLAGLWTAGTALRHLALVVQTNGASPSLRVDVVDWVAGTIGVVSVAVFFYTRKADRNPQLVLDLGLAYLVLTAFAIAVIINWEPVPAHTSVAPMISPIGPIMLMFAAIVPNTTARTLAAGLIAASMNPLSMLVSRARGTWEFGSASDAVLMHAPDYLLVPVAIVISLVVTRLGEHVANAREMGSYRIGELLGRGGMGEVYKATHRMLARPAAIKLIRPEVIGAGESEAAQVAIKRFRREAEVAARLRSPHTVELYDFGVTDDQTFYLVMELLDGMDLESLVQKEGPLPADRVICILRQVCESLEEAHAYGLVHRDIKPANIHLGRLGLQHDFVKVLDFGVVKSIVEPEDTQTQATLAGVAVGTPAYMAPEMAVGQPVDGRADVYALGCVAYYLLTGELVFEGSEVLHILLKRLSEDPPPLSGRTELRIPPDLERLVMTCLARSPEDRPSAAELSRSLAAVRLDPWTEAHAASWWKANHL
jgi:eukaryotic-like serine/threonine-protein kinase